MKLLTTICIPALLLGSAALSSPAMAQADANASGNAAAQPAQDANSAAVPAQTASTDTSANAPASSNTQLAMNTTGNASDLASVPDNQHKYSRAKKAAEDRSEDQTTKQLNQQESSLSGVTAQ
jgi:hypothetical protein